MQSTLPIVYASTSGNVEFVCETAAAVWQKAGFDCSLHRAEIAPTALIDDHDLLVLATSTWEHGVLNPFFNEWVKYLKTSDLSGKKAIFIGLGDMRYERHLFNQGYKELSAVFTEAGGEAIGRPLLLNGQPYDQKEARVEPWATEQLEILSEYSTHHE